MYWASGREYLLKLHFNCVVLNADPSQAACELRDSEYPASFHYTGTTNFAMSSAVGLDVNYKLCNINPSYTR